MGSPFASPVRYQHVHRRSTTVRIFRHPNNAIHQHDPAHGKLSVATGDLEAFWNHSLAVRSIAWTVGQSRGWYKDHNFKSAACGLYHISNTLPDSNPTILSNNIYTTTTAYPTPAQVSFGRVGSISFLDRCIQKPTYWKRPSSPDDGDHTASILPLSVAPAPAMPRLKQYNDGRGCTPSEIVKVAQYFKHAVSLEIAVRSYDRPVSLHNPTLARPIISPEPTVSDCRRPVSLHNLALVRPRSSPEPKVSKRQHTGFIP